MILNEVPEPMSLKKKWQNASSTELGVCSISIDSVPNETVSQDQTT